MSVLSADGCIQLMQTTAEDNLGHFASSPEFLQIGRNDTLDTFPHKVLKMMLCCTGSQWMMSSVGVIRWPFWCTRH